MAVVSIILNCGSKVIGFIRNWFVDEKNRREKRISDVVSQHVQNEASRVIRGKSSLVRAGAASLESEEEIVEVILRITTRGLKNPIGADYIKIRDDKRLLRFVRIASANTHRKTGEVALSSEQIIKIMDEEDKA